MRYELMLPVNTAFLAQRKLVQVGLHSDKSRPIKDPKFVSSDLYCRLSKPTFVPVFEHHITFAAQACKFHGIDPKHIPSRCLCTHSIYMLSQVHHNHTIEQFAISVGWRWICKWKGNQTERYLECKQRGWHSYYPLSTRSIPNCDQRSRCSFLHSV